MALPVPTAGPNVGPTITVVIARDWHPYLLGALEVLTLRSSWDVSQDDWEAFLHQWTEDFISDVADP